MDEPPAQIIDFSAQLEKDQVESQQIIGLKLQVEVIPEHYLYLDKTKLVWPKGFDAKNTQLNFSKTKHIYDKFSKKEKDVLVGSFEITTTVELPSFSKYGTMQIPLGLKFQACSDSYCLLPKKEFRQLNFTVTGGTLVAETESVAEKESNTFEKALEKGLLFTFLFVFFAGFLTSFTPCVFPMIPITLAVIGSRSQEASRMKSFSLSLVYVLGIALTYSLLGLFAAKTGALFGAFMSSPYVIAFIVILLVLMSLSMFGLFEIKTPQFLSNRLGKAGSVSGYSGAFVAGLLAGVIASPCVGPVLVGILTFVAKSQDAFMGFWLLFTFAMGLGSLFLILGSFSNLVQYLPKSGPWMNTTKNIFGISMLALAVYFAAPVVPRSIIIAIVGVGTISFGIILGFLRDGKNKVLKRFLGSLTILIGMILLFYSGKIYQENFGSQTRVESKMPGWNAYSEKQLLQSKELNKPVIIDFKADWCASCKELELKTFRTDAFKQATKDFQLLYVDATEITPEIAKLTEQYGILGLPTIVFIDRKGNVREDLTLTGFENFEDFNKRIQAVQ